MSIPTANRILSFDFSNPTSFPGSGLTVYDLTASGNNFQFVNSNYTFTSAYGGEVLIDNTNTLRRVADLFDYGYGTDAFTIVMWMQLNVQGNSDYNMFFCLQETGGTGSPANTVYFGAKPGLQFFVSDGTYTRDAAASTFSLNTWTMVTFTKQNNQNINQAKIYLNTTDLSMSNASSPANINFTTGFPAHIDGVAPAIGFWNNDMTVGEVSIYDAHLNSSQITNYYDATVNRYFPPPPPPASVGSGRQFGEGFNG